MENDQDFNSSETVCCYMDDSNRFFGIVVPWQFAPQKSKEETSSWENDAEAIVCLVLNYQTDHKSNSLLTKSEKFPFPVYVTAKKRTATKYFPSDELALIFDEKRNNTSNGLNTGRNIVKNIFSLSPEFIETVKAAEIVKRYLESAYQDYMPPVALKIMGWEKLVAELQKVFPKN